MWLPFSETRKFWRNVRVINDVIMDIISKKQQQLEQREGYYLFSLECCSRCRFQPYLQVSVAEWLAHLTAV